MRVLPAVLAAATILMCQPTVAAAHDTRVLATDVVDYTCVTTATEETQDIKVKVTLTMPTSTAVDSELTIGWRGAYADGTSLKAPVAGLDEGTKLYAYAGISDYPGLTSGTGVGTLGAITPAEIIELPTTQVDIVTTPNAEGTGTVRPAAINFGTSPSSPSIKCSVKNRDALTTYTLRVPSDGTDPDPDATNSESPSPDDTADETPDTDPEPEDTVTETPAGGADTGAGGEAGPDGRMVMGTGVVIMLAAVAGLRLRRPRKIRSPRAGGRSTGP